GAATSSVTPRATKLLLEDKISHNALSVFVGSFIFSIVGLVALQAGAYGEAGRLILFVVTIAVISVIIVTLLRWMEYVARLGRVNETIHKVEDAAALALRERLRQPYLGGTALMDESVIPMDSHWVFASDIGYVQYIDMSHLSQVAEDKGGTIYVFAMPGKFVDPAQPLVAVAGIKDPDCLKAIPKAFIIDRERSFRQDPRYGLAVLCEIATRALSPAINDPGTAIHIISVGVRVLSLWAKRSELAEDDQTAIYPRVHVPPLRADDLFDDMFPPIARDGAGIMEAALRLQKAFISLHGTGDADLQQAAQAHARLALKRSLRALTLDEDKERISATSLAGG
ncbi:MAG: DUF2254 domain-containing protein, partial [Alphaproteobacteria bacterium]|nr:DUF2254 domain-containing protein [Alphaproteobacteria bacterium]